MPDPRRLTWVATFALLAVAVVGLFSGSPEPRDRAYELEQRLRCPTCQTVSVADSPSETATAMRTAIDGQVAAGRSDEEILGYFRQRYGAWVLLDPPARGRTLLVWALPGLAVVVAAMVVARFLRRSAPVPPLSAEERELVRAESERVAGREEEP